MEETALNILQHVPDPLSIEKISEKYPVKYEESMNTVLVQEVLRYNKLLSTIKGTLRDLLKALKGLVVMSQQLETMSDKLYNNQVPEIWASKVSGIVDCLCKMFPCKACLDLLPESQFCACTAPCYMLCVFRPRMKCKVGLVASG